VARWRIGYAPATWTALISHLRSLGYDDAVIEAAGLARRSSRGTLIDQFRDRVILAIRGEHGTIAGFIGRAHPAARDGVPKYLNSPETAAFTKGDLLFGLHEARGPLASGAVPVLTEGPFDAIAVTAADPVRYAGSAPCGTALTSRQAAALSRAVDLSRARVLVALDGDGPGRDAVIKAHGVLLSVTRNASAVILPAGRDPAEILQADGPAVLSNLLHHRAEPLARIVIDAHLDRWAGQLKHAEGQLNAMRSAAAFIASALPPQTSRQILQITGGDYLKTLDESLHPIASPEVPAMAQTLPPDAICQIMRVADRLSSDCSEVTAEVANAITKSAERPKRGASHGLFDGRNRSALAFDGVGPSRLAAVGFPAPPSPPQARRQASTPTPRERSSRRWTAIPPLTIRRTR